MIIVFTILHIIVCVLLCGIVLMQSGKGGGLSGAFGGGGGMPSQMFGAKAMNTAMTKMTTYLAVAFFVTSSILFVLTKDRVSTTYTAPPAATQPVDLPVDATPVTDAVDAVVDEVQGDAPAADAVDTPQ